VFLRHIREMSTTRPFLPANEESAAFRGCEWLCRKTRWQRLLRDCRRAACKKSDDEKNFRIMIPPQ